MSPLTNVLRKTGNRKLVELTINTVNGKILENLYQTKPNSILDHELKHMMVIYFADYFDAQVKNGYFSQLFYNTKGIYNNYFSQALNEIGASSQLQVYQKFLTQFNSYSDDQIAQFLKSGYFGDNDTREDIDAIFDSEDYYEITPAIEDLIDTYCQTNFDLVAQELGITNTLKKLLKLINQLQLRISAFTQEFESISEDRTVLGPKDRYSRYIEIVNRMIAALTDVENNIFWTYVARELNKVDARFYSSMGFSIVTENVFNEPIKNSLQAIGATQTADRFDKLIQLTSTDEYYQNYKLATGYDVHRTEGEAYLNNLEMQLGGSLFVPDEQIGILLQTYLESHI